MEIAMNEMKLSDQQQAVLKWVREQRGSLNLVARAGCGKTTTLLSVVDEIRRAQPNATTFLGAFNKSIAAEIGSKLKQRGIDWRVAEASTMHSIGFRLWRRTAKDVAVDELKVMKLMDDLIFTLCEDEFNPFITARGELRQTVSLAKQSGFGWLTEIDDTASWYALLDQHGIEMPEPVQPPVFITAAQDLLKRSYSMDRKVVDFDDMITAPIVHNVVVRYPYDFVLIDEAQDTNAARRTLAMKLLRPGTGRMIAVGDDRQAIYGFTGADSDAMELIRSQLNSTVLPLNVTYRCPKTVVAEAQRYVPDIVAHESAPEGKVETIPLTMESYSRFHGTDAILCRNTAPLIELAYKLIGMSIPCRVEGREIGHSLELLAKRWKTKTLDALRGKLETYLEKETAKWIAKGREEKVAAINDKVQSLFALIDACIRKGKTQLADLVEMIGQLFGDTPTGEPQQILTLSTVHKSKGREWPRVFILRKAELMPSPWARKQWQVQQEENLIYVAITRSQGELVYLG
jgi:superfamily I DNA/RNA helicase